MSSFSADTIAQLHLVVSNLMYVLPAVGAWRRNMHKIVPWLCAVIVISSIHHACFDANFCLGQATTTNYMNLDVLISTTTTLLVFLVPTNYDLVEVLNGDAESGRRYDTPKLDRKAVKANGGRASYILAEHSYANVSEAIVIIITIVSNVLWAETIWAAFVPGLVTALLIAATTAAYWRMKRNTFFLRVNWPLALAALLIGGTGAGLFMFEKQLGRHMHPLWHDLTAIASWLWIAAVTKHIRIAPFF